MTQSNTMMLFVITDTPSNVFEKCIDIIGPFSPGRSHHRYILTVKLIYQNLY
jgi:hypothetical protein